MYAHFGPEDYESWLRNNRRTFSLPEIFFGVGPLIVLLTDSSTPASPSAGPYQKTAASGGDSPLIFLVFKVRRVRAFVKIIAAALRGSE